MTRKEKVKTTSRKMLRTSKKKTKRTRKKKIKRTRTKKTKKTRNKETLRTRKRKKNADNDEHIDKDEENVINHSHTVFILAVMLQNTSTGKRV